MAGLKPLVPRLRKIWADGAYTGEELARWCQQTGEWTLEIAEREEEFEGFKALPKRRTVERTFGRLVRNRCLGKDYGRMVQTSEALVQVATIRLLLRRSTNRQGRSGGQS